MEEVNFNLTFVLFYSWNLKLNEFFSHYNVERRRRKQKIMNKIKSWNNPEGGKKVKELYI
jgi:hypothetical protein